MLSKEGLKKKFSKDWKNQYQVEIFKEKGFVRKTCRKCGKNFWTLDPERETCSDPPCQNYEFIGKPITKEKLNYIETWRVFEKFFVQNGHESVPRYPVVDRWRPDLFFTIASIQDFQRIDQGNTVMEYPADPLIVPQVCLRFPDIPNVGVTGRHHTSFIMPGQHSFGKYWKDKTIELNFKFLRNIMGIPERELVYIEDMWAMPDFSQFGPSLETFSKGLELVNSVFSQYTASGKSYKELPLKVIDVGWGHERLVWFSNGTPSGYDCAFGPVTDWMKKQAGLHKDTVFEKYSKFAGGMTFDEVDDVAAVRKSIAKKLGVSVDKLNSVVEPMQALYAIADHSKTLLFAATDGGIPSNVGGGYNLRVILRRALSFIQEFGFNFDLIKIAELHADFLKPMFPELKDGLEPLKNILDVEKERYSKTMARAGMLIKKHLKTGITTPTLIKLYTSDGIAPELVDKIAKKEGKPFHIPEDFYAKLTEQHLTGKKEFEKDTLKADVAGVPKTGMMYYEKSKATEFTAKVIKVIGDWVVLDKTLFYPMGGGQPSDIGTISANGKTHEVRNVQKIGEVVLHNVKGLKEGQTVKGKLDWKRRFRLMQMHTSTHIVAGAARKILGNHIWQAGAKKDVDASRIDLTHYKPFTPQELEKIEKLANEVVRQSVPVDARFVPRNEAEQKYGFVLYQGGASPGKMVRVVKVGDLDVEACGGVHLSNTKEAEKIKIIRTERIQDGVNRLVFTCGLSADQFTRNMEELFSKTLGAIKSLPLDPKTKSSLKPGFDARDLKKTADTFSIEPKLLPQTVEKFTREVVMDNEALNYLRKRLGVPTKNLQERLSGVSNSKTLAEMGEAIFSLWKQQRKEAEKLRRDMSSQRARELLEKAKDSTVFEIIKGARKELIETASQLLSLNPKLTVILANEGGEIIGMSKTEDVSKRIREICKKSGGSGGGSPTLAQGKVELSKLRHLL